jgi:uncharacterized protein (TIGR02145 family)
MFFRALITVLLLICSQLFVIAQSKDILAKSAMLNAEEAYNQENYNESLNYLEETEKILGKTNSRIQYLKVKICMVLCNQDPSNLAKWEKADTELKKYFEVTTDSEASPEKNDEMIMAVSKIKKAITEIEKKEKAAEEERIRLAKAEEERNRREDELYNMAKNNNQLYDRRDKKYYKTVKIGQQVWMAENIAYNTGSGCWGYNYDSSYVAIYGFYYDFENAKKACPTGWHLPSKDEFETLFANSDRGAFKSLVVGGNSGFSAKMSSLAIDGTFYLKGYASGFWSSTLVVDRVWVMAINDSNKKASIGLGRKNQTNFWHVRCLQDN